MRHSMRSVLAVMGLVAVAGPVPAVVPHSGQWLHANCLAYEQDPASAAGERCVSYVNGFLDGAVATDERVARNVAAEYERSGWVKRATRTRLGRRAEHFDPGVYAEYCLGQPVPIAEVVEHVIERLQRTPPQADSLARDIVYEALRENYRCAQ